MNNGDGSLTEAGASERSGASPFNMFHDAQRSGEAPASAPIKGGVEAQPRKRRKLSRTEQLRLVREYEALPQGEKGLFLRRQGLYSSQICAWRKIRDEKFLKSAPKRGRKAKEVNPLAKELAEKERHLQKVLRRNELLEKVIEVQKKISEITGIPLKAVEIDEND